MRLRQVAHKSFFILCTFLHTFCTLVFLEKGKQHKISHTLYILPTFCTLLFLEKGKHTWSSVAWFVSRSQLQGSKSPIVKALSILVVNDKRHILIFCEVMFHLRIVGKASIHSLQDSLACWTKLSCCICHLMNVWIVGDRNSNSDCGG